MRSFPLLLVMLLSLSLLACKPAADTDTAAELKPTAADSPPACVLRAGFDAWEPYHYLGQGQQPQGLDIEILQTLAAELNCELSLQQDTWAALLRKLQSTARGQPSQTNFGLSSFQKSIECSQFITESFLLLWKTPETGRSVAPD